MKQFIKTTDIKTANQLIGAGFKLISHIGSIYTFLNVPPKNFNFDSVNTKTLIYDNTLSL